MNKKFKRTNKDALSDIFPEMDTPRGIVRNLMQDVQEVNCYEYPIKGEITDPIDYEELVNMLRSACENDIVRLSINTEGGNLHTVQELVEEIYQSHALVACSVYGECCSGGTMLALACASMDDYDITDNSSWLFHNASWGTGGKAQDVEDSVDHSRILFRRVMKQHYSDFLTEDEIEEVIRGKQLWMFGDEVKERLATRDAIRQARVKEAALVAEAQASKPTKKPRAKKAVAEEKCCEGNCK